MNNSPTSFQRARRPEQVTARRVAILDSARRLAQRDGVRAVTLSDVAIDTGVARSHVLRYFETREAIYLELTEQQYADWRVAARAALAATKPTPAAVAGALAQSFAQRPLFCDLQANMSSALEHNVSGQTARRFKLTALSAVTDVAEGVAAALPNLRAAQARELVEIASALVAGLWPMANPPQHVVEQLNDPELTHARIEFEPRLSHALHALIRGFAA